MGSELKARVRDSVLQALRAGVVPRTGFHHIVVARDREIREMHRDVARVADGGSGIRFVIGEYGAGKTFFLNLVRELAMGNRLVTVSADLSSDHRLYSSKGQAQALYSELMRNMATRVKPDGGALPNVVERFVTKALAESREAGTTPEHEIRRRVEVLSEMVGGYDFGTVVLAYWTGHDTGDQALQSDAIRWLRGEFSTKTDARRALGVRSIVTDATFYDHLKLVAGFCRLAEYGGLLVCLDELVSVFTLQNAQARRGNYDQMLRIVNDSIQGNTRGLGFLMAGTPEFLQHPRRGVYSHEALRSRLEENVFAGDGLVDFSGPVIRLDNLTEEDLYVLLEKVRDVYESGDAGGAVLPDEAIKGFMQHWLGRLGEAYFRTPRNTIKAFVNMLSILGQNPGTTWQDVLGLIEVEADSGGEVERMPVLDEDGEDPTDDDLAAFRL
jgi:hypothetical protein